MTMALRRRCLFSGLSRQAVTAVKGAWRLQPYAVNSVIVTHGARVSGLFIVIEGRVRLTINACNGSRIGLGWAYRQQTFTLGNLLTGTVCAFTAEASAHSLVAFIPQANLDRLLRRFPELRSWSDRQLCREIEQSRRLLSMRNVAADLHAVVASLLAELAEADWRGGGHYNLVLDIRQQEIADMLGHRRETINRSMMWLQGKRLIRISRGIIHIPELLKLRALLG